MPSLPTPQIVRCFFDESVVPHLPAMKLRWDADDSETNRAEWRLPDDVVVTGPAPERFGIDVERLDVDSFLLRVLWNRVAFVWNGVSSGQIAASSLTPILHALGTDLWYLLDQPLAERRAA